MTKTLTINRRGWLACFLQKRRRERIKLGRSPAPLLSERLVAHFGFDENSWECVDDVGGRVLAPYDNPAQRVAGLHGLAVNFVNDGCGLLGTESTSVFSPTENGFAVSLWVNFMDLIDSEQAIYIVSVWQDQDWPDGTSWHITSYNPSNGGLQVEIMSPDFSGMSGSADFSMGWVHLCLVYEPVANQWTFYVNADVADSQTFGYSPAAGLLGVGMDANPMTPPAQGAFDELAFWSRALSADEVAQLYNNGAGLAYPY